MKNEKEMNEVLHEVKNVDTEINKLLVPILQDTIKDTNKHNKRMFIMSIIELFIILIVVLFSVFLVYKQNVKYQEFLNQFDFTSDEYTYTQDLDTHEGGDILNPNLTVTN